MTDQSRPAVGSGATEKDSARKPYQKPDFQFERVFETLALACVKTTMPHDNCASPKKS